jgi:hypothetical protein
MKSAKTSSDTEETGIRPAVRLLHLLNGSFVTQAISVAARLGVADQLADGPRDVTDLAGAVGAHAPSLHRLLRGLTDLGILTELPGQEFALTRLGEPLGSTAPDSVRAIATMMGMPFCSSAWTKLYESIRTGEQAFTLAHGQPLFDYLAGHPDDAALFAEAMTANAIVCDGAWQACDFGRFRRLIDVGGGRGHLLAGILAANPHLEAVLFDLPDVVAAAAPTLSNAGVIDRCRVEGGNFFERVPADGDVYLLANVIHDWDDESSVRILRTCRQAMAGDAVLLLVEGMLAGQPAGDFSHLADLSLLTLAPGGRLRTGEDYAGLLESAALRLARVVPSAVAGVIEAVPMDTAAGHLTSDRGKATADGA